jgi:arsenite-transporting ATPase
VISRFIGWFREFGIPVGGVIVNMLIDPEQVNDRSPDFVRNRFAMQNRHLVEIQKRFDTLLRGSAPLFETEVRGVERLGTLAGALFG